MAFPIPKLDTLPPEILKRIASHSPADSLFALISVSRRLYATIHDRNVYKSVIRRGNNYLLPHEGASIVPPWDISFLSLDTSIITYARWALADLRTRQWLAYQTYPDTMIKIPCSFPDEEVVRDSELTNMSVSNTAIEEFVPQLIIKRHPLLKHVLVEDLLRRCKTPYSPDRSTDITDTIRWIFAMAVLQRTASALDSENQSLVDWLLGFRDLASTQIYHGHYSLTAGVFALELLSHCRRYSRGWVFPPHVDRMPLEELLDFGLPFSRRLPFAQRFLNLSRAFIEDGEWVGYYSYSTSLAGTRIDPPMERIHFTVTETHDDGKLVLESRGLDRVGDFGLTGNVNKDGAVEMVKIYNAGFSWQWRGALGPLGIVGTWGHSGGFDHGIFWLWKKDWSPARR